MNEKQKQAIEKMYEKGLVNVQEIAEPMLERYDELDIQQCRFVIEYLLADRDFDENYIQQLEEEIEKEKEKNKELKDTLKQTQNSWYEDTKVIEKQSKEIEELKEHQIIFTNDYKPIGSKGRKFISENKIKAKIEELEKGNKNTFIRGEKILVLQSLLEKE